MSSIIFHTDRDQAFVATDTLAVSENGEPFMFTTKTFAVPHLKVLIAGTGAGGFCGRWFVQVNDRMVLRCIEHLNYHTPENLQNLWDQYREDFEVSDDLTTTIYQFGFDENGRMRVFAYRSANDFQSEELDYGMAVKPACEVPENYNLPEDLMTLMSDQRAEQNSYPANERIYIGGEIQVHHLTKHGVAIQTHGEFPDFGENEKSIYENFEASFRGAEEA